MMKRFILLAVIVTVSVLVSAQTSTVTHIVQRGESIESIAKYYHVSVEDINKANPNAEGMLYVGMKLVVPQDAQVQEVQHPVQESEIPKTAPVSAAYRDRIRAHDKEKAINPSLRYKVLAGVTAAQWTGKDFKGDDSDEEDEYSKVDSKSAFGFHLGLNVDYLFTERFYAGIGLMYNQTGYKKECIANSGEYWNDEGANYESEMTIKMTTNKFDLPIHIGGIFNISSSTDLFLEAGPVISYAVSGNTTTTGYMTTHDDIHSGETEHIDTKVKIGKGSLKDFQKFGYGLSATAGISCNKLLLQFTYQRGLTKMIKKTKQYEQNLLFSIGYEF